MYDYNNIPCEIMDYRDDIIDLISKDDYTTALKMLRKLNSMKKRINRIRDDLKDEYDYGYYYD